MREEELAVEDAIGRYERALDNCLVLNAARNFLSPRTRAVLGRSIADADWAGHALAEGGPHSAAELAQIEAQTRRLIAGLLGTSAVELRAPSGSVANGVAACALASADRQILVPPEWAYGHKSLQGSAYLAPAGGRISELPWDGARMQPDLDKLRSLLRKLGPRLMIFGTSRPLFPEPFEEIKRISEETDSLLMYDGAHVLGLIAGDAFPNPLRAGFDALTGSTHKTFPGPMGGLVVCRSPELGSRIAALTDQWLSSFSVSRIAALAVAMAEFTRDGKAYAAQVVQNARNLARELHEGGVPVVASDRGFTSTHQVLVDVSDLPDLPHLTARLADAGILVNKPSRADRRLRNKPADGAWLRLGTAACTRLGMSTAAMVEIAHILRRLLLQREDPVKVRGDVEELGRRHPAVVEWTSRT